MRWIAGALAAAGRHGRLLLIVGLLAGVFLPSAAAAMRPYVGEAIAGLLFLACLRIGPRQAVGAGQDIGVGVAAAIVLQLCLPVLLAILFRATGWTGPNALALTLMAAAAPISGSPNLVIMLGSDPAPALRQLVVGTVLLPFTALVVFLLLPGIGDTDMLFLAAGRLLAIIGAAAALAFVLRWTVFRELSAARRDALDGLSAVLMAAVVVGLMSAIGETWPRDPWAVLAAAAIAFAANICLQIATALAVARTGLGHLAVPLGVAAGNRNVALFLTALPAATTDPALLFIACYQVPMYLTPLMLGGWYRKISPGAAMKAGPRRHSRP